MLRPLKHLHGHVAGNGGEAVEEFFEAVIVFEIIKERLDRHPCSGEDGGTAENIWVGCDQVGRAHNEMLPDKLRDGEGGPIRTGISPAGEVRALPRFRCGLFQAHSRSKTVAKPCPTPMNLPKRKS